MRMPSATKVTSNGTHKTKKRKRSESNAAAAIVPSSQPPRFVPPNQLVEDGLRDYLDSQAAEGPFVVETLPLSRKKVKRGNQDVERIDDLFERRLTVQYNIRPNNAWSALKKYKRFTVGDIHHRTDVSIGVGEYIFVKHDEWSDDKLDTSTQWKAIVLEVRALDSEHVYILVAWLNRPEDLEDGRKPYHGRSELIPSNQLDVIDAMTVNGRLDLVHWSESSDDIPHQYFWRQTYDAAYTKTFSELKRFCVEDTAHNPDDMIVQCEQEECRRWMHVKCIARAAARAASETALSSIGTIAYTTTGEKDLTKKSDPGEAVDLPLDAESSAVGKAACANYVAEVFIKDADRVRYAAEAEQEDDGIVGTPTPAADLKPITTSKIIITKPSGQAESQAVLCLLCQAAMT
ncbi:hypothetical protein AMS68_001261 [Peltaster fructicola]|uniref:BAH domain-containing protein n=1 Tax=Peltaster fructicola TaxID=286661 RepID=A0A6H0XLZ1_9PEZI|nr:hypothetical protein AMS68_001261 [Peltaster fructicola]